MANKYRKNGNSKGKVTKKMCKLICESLQDEAGAEGFYGSLANEFQKKNYNTEAQSIRMIAQNEQAHHEYLKDLSLTFNCDCKLPASNDEEDGGDE